MCSRYFGIGFVVVVLAAGFLYYLSTVTQTPPSPAAITPQAAAQAQRRINDAVNSPEPITSVSTLPEPVKSVQALKITTGARAKTVPPGTAIRVKFAENDINTMIQANSNVMAKMHAEKVTAASIHFFAPNVVDITAWFRLHGDDRQATITGTIAPDGQGGISFSTDASKLGALPLPTDMTADRLDKEADKVLGIVLPTLPLNVQTVSIDGSELTLTGPKK